MVEMEQQPSRMQLRRRRDGDVAPLIRELELERRRLAAVADGDGDFDLGELGDAAFLARLTRRVLQRGERKHPSVARPARREAGFPV